MQVPPQPPGGGRVRQPGWGAAGGRRRLLDDALATLADLPDHAHRILAAAEEFLDELGPMAAPD